MKPGSLPTFDEETGDLNVVVETPRRSRCKFAYDEGTGLFALSKRLPAGLVFPFSFGFIPSTRGGDGDPLDVLLLFDEPLPPGLLVVAHLLGAIRAQQTENKRTTRNDRLLAVPVLPYEYGTARSIRDVDPRLLCEIEEFFISYQRLMGKDFKVLGVLGPKEALKLVRRAQEAKE